MEVGNDQVVPVIAQNKAEQTPPLRCPPAGQSTAAESSTEATQVQFAYTLREDFTSEIFKIEVRNLPRFGFSEFKKLLKNKLKLNPAKIKSPMGQNNFAYICLKNEVEKDEALKKLNGYVWKGKTITASTAKAVADPLIKRRMEDDGDKPAKKKRTCIEATAPLSGMIYDDQLKQKQADVEQILKNFGRDLFRNSDSSVKDYIKKSQSNFNGLPCEFVGIKGSPKINEYRNKSEFAIGRNSNGEKVVGFRLGSYADGSTEVGAIDDLPHIPSEMKLAAKMFEDYVRISEYDVFNPEFNKGVFKMLSARMSEFDRSVMLIVTINTKDLSEEQVKTLKSDIVDYFKIADDTEKQIAVFYIQEISRKPNGEVIDRMRHVHGSTHIVDVIHGLKFRVSPQAFFQVNTTAANVLYQCAIDLANPNDETTILDVCCGTGTIGLCFSKHCKQVLGVEIIPEAVKDAQYNATANNIKNCKFHSGNSDDYISSLVREANTLSGDNVVAIIDPPRAGLHIKSIGSIRNSGVNRFVYMSCSPKSAVKNWIDLARPCSKTMRGDPFVPTKAIAVDMFPHTVHVELVILFERISHLKQDGDKKDTLTEESAMNVEQSKEDETITEELVKVAENPLEVAKEVVKEF